jgi:diacylglycerol O-acyltransferase
VHHSVVDGISAMRMGMRALSPDPEERDLPPVWAYKPKKRGRGLPSNPVDAVSSLARLTTGASRQIATVPALAREIYSVTQKAKDDPNFVSIFQAPDTILNQCITGSRRFAAQSYSLDRLKRLSGAFNCTLNDVVLSMCGHALREYLISQNALPDRPLIAMVPMSLRKDDSAGGNQIAMILANLGTHICDPANRLRVVQASVREAKKRFSQMSSEEILNFTALSMAPTGLNLLTGLAPKWRAFNVIISNVPGPHEPLYWNGARLEGMYPVSIVLDRIALNMTLTSYRGQIEFGLIACRRTLPSMQRLLDYLEQSIRELEIAAGFK